LTENEEEFRLKFTGQTCEIEGREIYGTRQCAEGWLAVARHESYPYFADEFELLCDLRPRIAELISNQNFDLLAVGPADSLKELSLLNYLDPQKQKSRVTIFDNSTYLGNYAKQKITNRGYKNVTWKDIDFCQPQQGELTKLRYRNALRQNLVTCFGNTIGNYEGFTIIDKLRLLLMTDSLLLFGYHRQISKTVVDPYIAYKSEIYLAHMRFVVEATGLDPQLGQIDVRVYPSPCGFIDIVEHIYIPSQSQESAVREMSGATNWDGIIRIDRSAKFSDEYVNEAVSSSGLRVLINETSRSGRVCVFACRA
jgi:hypothetical protein